MSIAFLLTTLVVVATPGTGAVYSIGPGPVPWLQGRHRRRVRRHPRRRPAHVAAITGLAAILHARRSLPYAASVVNRPSVWSDR
jgi:hypothetical protein